MRFSHLRVNTPPHRRNSQDRSPPGLREHRGSRPAAVSGNTTTRQHQRRTSGSVAELFRGEQMTRLGMLTDTDHSQKAIISQAAAELGAPTTIKSAS
jgi:hypothetical protein